MPQSGLGGPEIVAPDGREARARRQRPPEPSTLDNDVIAGAAIEDVQPGAAQEDVVAVATQ